MPNTKNSISLVDEINGSYSFCAKCPSNGNCCSRVKPEGKVDSPVLFPHDTQLIEQYSGEDADSFSTPLNPEEGLERIMHAGVDGCYYYREGRCAIYSVRPIDCRLFPLDIIEKPDGKLVWIAYISLCPVEFDPHAYLKQAKKLLPQLRANVLAYARAKTPGMDREAFVELADVEIDP